ncbi:MAG: LPS-assembly lipoprotein LptE [Rhodoferax sp.]
MPQRRHFLAGLGALGALALGGCGFRLRGAPQYAFDTVAVSPASGSAIAAALVRQLGARVRTPQQSPQVLLELLDETRESATVGVGSSGQVLEMQLRLQVRFRLRTPQGRELIPSTSIAQQRELSYSETAALAKDAEQAALYRDMQADAVQQILRRLAAVQDLGPAPARP